jgi:transcriptional regulator with XRE-family HTH domain
MLPADTDVKSWISARSHAAGVDGVRLGQAIRALRRHRGWTQVDLARRARVSQASISRAETGQASRLTMRTVERVAEALGARLSVRVYWHGEELDRLLDAAHAGIVDQVVAILVANGWEVVPEATFNHFGERGSIDVLAWHPGHRALLIIEVKSVVPDVQALLGGVDRKARIAPALAEARGWRVRTISSVIVLPDDRTARRRVESFAATFDRAYPARTRDVRRWMANPAEAIAGIMFLAAIQRTDPRQRVRAVGTHPRAGTVRSGPGS